MKKRFESTRDGIEKAFKDILIPSFPNYAIFWEDFYGFKEKIWWGLEPYGLKFSTKIQGMKKRKINGIYKKINARYYHLFTHLAGAYTQIKTYEKCFESDDLQEAFKSAVALDIFFFHLGVVQDMLGLLIKYILKDLSGSNLPKDCKLKGFSNHIKNNNKVLHKKIDSWRKKVHMFRTRVTHISGIGKQFVMGDGGNFVLIPEKIKISGDWWQDGRRVKGSKVKEISDFMNEALEETLYICNEIFGLLIKEYHKYLSNKGIKINYGGVKN